MVRVRLVQIDSSDTESVADRIHRVLGELPTHAAAADIVVLPELWHIGAFNLPAVAAHTLTHDDLIFSQISEIAREHATWIHPGSFAIVHGDKAVNRAMIFNPAGERVAQYDKQHLFGFADGERTVMDAGSELVQIDTPLGATGLATCYDLRFPEMFRAHVDAGVETVLMCSGWPTPRMNHWEILTAARAIENQVFFIACNGRGTHNGVTLGGGSVVVSPKGEILARATAEDAWIDADVELSEVAAWRQAFPVLADRKKF